MKTLTQTEWFSLEDLANITGYSTYALSNHILSDTRFTNIVEANSKAVGSSHKKYYSIKVLEAIKTYQLEAHGNMKNQDAANKVTKNILQNAKQMLDLQIIAESGNVEAMQQFMSRMLTYTQSVHEVKEAKKRAEIAEQKQEQLKITLDESKQWYSVKRMQKLNPHKRFDWRLLKTESENLGFEIKKVFDANYGEVNAYNVVVWQSLYFDTLNYE